MNQQSDQIWNVPNKISMVRLLLSFVVFALIPMGYYMAALVVFIIAASTDWMDGWWARKFNQVTQLGRILDPFCDKIIICGTYILLAEASRDYLPWYGRITGWMAVIIVGRELLVTVLRSMIEGSGGDFSAKMAGKLKMWFQCFAVGGCLLALTYRNEVLVEGAVPNWLNLFLIASVWLALLSTLYSGYGYVIAASNYLITKPESNDASDESKS